MPTKHIRTADEIRARYEQGVDPDNGVPYLDPGRLDHLNSDIAEARIEISARMTELAGADSMTASEQREFDALTAEANRLAVLEGHARLNVVDRSGVPYFGTHTDLRDVRVLAPEQRVADWARSAGELRDDGPLNDGPLNLGRYVRGIVSGDWSGADAERRALAEGTMASGGFMVPTPLSATVIDRARNQGRVFQAGAQTVPMTSQTLKMARVAGDPTAAWHSENALIADSDMTLESVTFTAQTLTGIVRASREVIEDATGIGTELESAFADVVALALDRAALYGTGTAPEPRGVKNSTGITTQSQGANGAALTNYDPFVDAIGTLRDNNEDATGIIYAPRTERAINKLKDTTNQPMRPPQVVEGVPRYATNQVPTNLTQGVAINASDAFVADWAKLLVGIRTSFEIKVLTERWADFGQVAFMVWLRGDVVVARPKAFVVITGIIP